MTATTEQTAVPNPDIAALRDRSIQSITLATELFNRPTDCARPHTVVILLHHSFELILKSLIVARRGTAFDEARGYSYGFDKCLVIAQEENLITADHRKFLSILDNARDGAIHYYQTISEPILYIFAQASVSLFNELIKASTGKGLLEFLPHRVVPLSAISPQQLGRVLDEEFEALRKLLHSPDTNKQHALAMLRPLMAFKIGGEEQHRRMTNEELEVAAENLAAADTWRVVFPEIAKVEFDSAGEDIAVRFKVVKESADALPVRVLKPDEAHLAKGVIIHKEINILDKFNMGLNDVARHLKLTAPKTLALVREYSIQKDTEAFRPISFGRSKMNRYSKRTIDLLKDKVADADMVWKKHRSALTSARTTNGN